MKRILMFPVWLVAFLLRFVLMAVGVVVVPFVGRGWFIGDIPADYDKNRWTRYVWSAWRNPLEGLDSTLEQPIPETMPNPDELVRTGYPHNGALVKKKSASRWMEHDIFWEYWYLRRIWTGRFDGIQRYFEFRIGWKFVDGNEDFVPTFQCGPKK